MNGYSRIVVSTDLSPAKSTSIDFSDPTFPPPPKEAQQKEDDDAEHHGHLSWQQEEEGGERFGVILSRSGSSASQRFANGPTTLQTAVRRAFSMRKSSSVREGYWRIHDTGDEDGDGELMEEQQQHQQMRCARRKKKGKFLRACKRLFGF